MRKLFAITLIALLFGVGIVAIIETDPGYVLVSYGNYTLESSLWVGIILLGLSVFLFYQLLRLVYGLISGRRTLSNWLGSRRADQAHRNTTRGMISFTEGNWLRARRHLLNSAQNNETPLVNYLFAARASDQLEEPEKVSEYLQAAADAEPEANVALEIVRAENKLRAGEYEQALSVLDDASRNPGKYPRVLVLMQQAYEGLQDWDRLLALLPDLLKHKHITNEEFDQTRHDILQRRLRAAEATELDNVWQNLVTEEKQNADLLRIYISRLIELGDHDAAEKSILRGLKRRWDPQLVKQYGLIESDETSARLSKAERWLAEHPEDPELLLCLGRLCLRDNLWGKARDYFESSYRARVTPEVCAELGRLLAGLGEPKVAAAYYREGLAASATDLPDLPMPDKVVSNHHLLERSESA